MNEEERIFHLHTCRCGVVSECLCGEPHPEQVSNCQSCRLSKPPEFKFLPRTAKETEIQGCAGICLKHKSPYRAFIEKDHCVCKRCDCHMDWAGARCPCCGYHVRRRRKEGRADEAKRVK